jgi:syntaxin 5
MPFLDRTEELNSIVQLKIQKKNFEGELSKKRVKQPLTNKEASKKFYSLASTVSQGLQNTADILQKLTKLVKKRTPFNDNDDHIQHLTLMVKEQLANHDHALRDLSDLIQQQQKQAQQTVYYKTEQSTQHSNHILTGLNSRLMYATQQFQKILMTRTKQIKTQRERQNLFTHDAKPSSSRPVKVMPTAASPMNNTVVNISSFNPALEEPGLAQGNQLQEYAPNKQININDQIIKKRTDEVLSIEQDISQLGGMMNHLAIMIKQQGELAQRIDTQVEIAQHNIEMGQSELMKYWQRIQGNQGLILKMFFVLVIFIIFVAVFVIK